MPEVTDAVNFWLNLLRMDTASATSLDRSLVFETVFEEQESKLVILHMTVSIRRGPRRGLGRWLPVPGCEFM